MPKAAASPDPVTSRHGVPRVFPAAVTNLNRIDAFRFAIAVARKQDSNQVHLPIRVDQARCRDPATGVPR